ncbi:MAG: amino acid-binding protein [Chloroflexi bacterium]|jgi:hypothetical protein|nr:amino acid-binding protein [Chloroflexota bacterium]
MAIDLTVRLVNQPGTLLRATDALGRAGVNVEGACAFVCEERGVYHVLVEDRELAYRALIDAGLEVMEERVVVLVPVEDRPGAGAALLRRIADAGANIDLLYVTTDGRIVLGGDDVPGIRRALG